MDVSSYLVGAAVVIWVIARQFAGRWVPARRTLLLPLVLVVVGSARPGTCTGRRSRSPSSGPMP